MNTTSEVQWLEWDDTAEDVPEKPTVGSRRLLLRGTAGGLALAASGLFVPDWLEEAEARDGVLGGAKGGRHGKNRRGRHRKRTHGDKKDNHKVQDKVQDKPLPFRASALTVVNDLAEPVPCKFFYAKKKPGDNYDPFNHGGDQTIKDDDSYRYDPLEFRVGVLIRELNYGKDIFCDVRNVTYWYPRGGVTTGVNLDPHNGNVGTAYIPEQNFSEGEEKYNQRAVLRRLNDDSHGERRIEWRLIIR